MNSLGFPGLVPELIKLFIASMVFPSNGVSPVFLRNHQRHIPKLNVSIFGCAGTDLENISGAAKGSVPRSPPVPTPTGSAHPKSLCDGREMDMNGNGDGDGDGNENKDKNNDGMYVLWMLEGEEEDVLVMLYKLDIRYVLCANWR